MAQKRLPFTALIARREATEGKSPSNRPESVVSRIRCTSGSQDGMLLDEGTLASPETLPPTSGDVARSTAVETEEIEELAMEDLVDASAEPPEVVAVDRDNEPEPPPTPRPRLTIELSGVRFPVLDEPFLIGRSRRAQLCVKDPNFSREHAQVRGHGSGYILEDLGSTNGLLVDGERYPVIHLRDGLVVYVGTQALLFHLGDRNA